MGYDLAKALGAAHGLEIAFIFGEFTGGLGLGYLYPATPQRDALSRSMMSYWSEFAYSGVPGAGRDGSEVRWTPWGADGNHMILLDTNADAGIRMSAETVSVAQLKQRLLHDTTIVDQKERCGLYANLFRDEEFDEQEYLTLGSDGCAAYDPASLRLY
jgi:para-nitrobenzyl esterase